MTCFHAEPTCRGSEPAVYDRPYRAQISCTLGAIWAYRLLGRSGKRWCSIWWDRLPVMMCMSLLPLMLAEPIIWRRYHSPRVSPSMEVLAKVSTPSGKWPHMMTECAHKLRIRLAVAFAPTVWKNEGPDSSGWTR